MGEEDNTEEETQRSIVMPAFQQNSAMAMAMATITHSNNINNNNKSLHVFRGSRRGQKIVRHQQVVEVMKEESGGGAVVEKRGEEGKEEEGGEKEEEEKEEEEEDREEVERKINALQKIVPGGESLGVDKLFDETAGYIVALQYQVKALRALAGFFEKLNKEKTKFGG